MARPTSTIELTELQRAVAVGSLLGDSSLNKPTAGKNYHLSCYHAIRQREWLLQKHSWLSPASRPIQWCEYVDKRDGKSRAGGRFHTVSIPDFTNLAPLLYRNGKKVISGKFLDLFTEPISLACLICDDGSWDGAGIAIASKQFTVSENRRLAAHLRDVYGLSVTAQVSQRYPYVRITAASAERARDICAPFVPKFLAYKFGPEGYRTTLTGLVAIKCGKCCETFYAYASANQRYCSQGCAATTRPNGYATRTASRPCDECKTPFVIYNRRQQLCASCR